MSTFAYAASTLGILFENIFRCSFAVCLSLVSEVYQEEDYIRDYDVFTSFVGA